MRTRVFLPGGILLLLALLTLVGLMPGLTLAAAPEAKKGAAPTDSLCASCHEDQVKAFQNNPHVRDWPAKKGGADAACESCHGPGKNHAEAGGDVALIRGLKGWQGSETCLGCHDKMRERWSYRTGVHASSEAVNCLSCHSIHHSDFRTQRLLVKPQVELCGGCHAGPVTTFKSEPYTHRVGRGGIECSSCHNAHGRPQGQTIKLTRAGDLICVSCHAEKKGPHVYEHVNNVAGNCMSCHRPHGSPNMHMLTRSTVAGLCLECHSNLGWPTLGSQPPSIHNISLPKWRNCTTCHTAVHGSNFSPQLFK